MLRHNERRSPRQGTSLVELLVALALFGIIAMATLRALDRQARFHSGVLAILESRSQHAAAHEAVAVELRGASAEAGDVARMSDTSVVFRLPVGAGVACNVAPGVLDLTPDTLASGQGFARFRTTPQAGDTAWVFDEGATDVAPDDRWIALPITAATRAPDRCTGGVLVDPVLDAGRISWRLSVGGTMPSTVVNGAPIRLTRMARFALYRGGTGEHWLGFTEAQPGSGTWVTIQPVSGPYLPFSGAMPQAGGVAWLGRDSSGMGVSGIAPRPSTIAVATRTRTTRSVRLDGLTRGPYADSLHSLIALRNTR